MRKLRLLALFVCSLALAQTSQALELKDLEGLWEGKIETDWGEGPKEVPSLLHVFNLKSGNVIDSLKAMVNPDQEFGGVFARYFSLTGVTDFKVVDDAKVAFTVTAGMDAKKTAQVSAAYTPTTLEFTIPAMNNEQEMVVKLRRVPANERAKLTDKDISGEYRGTLLPEHVAPENRTLVADVVLDLNIEPDGAKINVEGMKRLPQAKDTKVSPFTTKVIEAQRFDDILYIFFEKPDPRRTVGDNMVARLYPDRMRVYGIVWEVLAGGGTFKLIEPDEDKE